jgi:hypothetical protein
MTGANPCAGRYARRMRYPGENAAGRAPGRRHSPSARIAPPEARAAAASARAGGKAASEASVFAPGYTGGRAPGSDQAAAGSGRYGAASNAAGKGPLRGFPPAPGMPPPLYPPGPFAAWNRARGDNGYDSGTMSAVSDAWPALGQLGASGSAEPGYSDAGYADAGYADPEYPDQGYGEPGRGDPDQGYGGPGHGEVGSADPGYSALAVSEPAADVTSTQTWAAVDDAAAAFGWGEPGPAGPGQTDADAWSASPAGPRQTDADAWSASPAGPRQTDADAWLASPAGPRQTDADAWPDSMPPGAAFPAALAGPGLAGPGLAGPGLAGPGLAGPQGPELDRPDGPDDGRGFGVGRGGGERAAGRGRRGTTGPDQRAMSGRAQRPGSEATQRLARPDQTAATGPGPRPVPGPGRGTSTRGRGSRGRKRPRGRRLGARTMVICALALIVVIGATYLWFSRAHKSPAPTADSQRSTAVTQPKQDPTPSPTPSLGPWGHIETRALDPVPLSLAELFPAQFANGSVSYVKTVQKAKAHCAAALIGGQLVAAVGKGGCTQAMRASYLSSDHKVMGTIGVLNLVTTTAAEQAGKAAGSSEIIAQLPGAKGPTRNLTRGTGFEAAEVKGHYLVLVWAEFVSLHAPGGPEQKATLESFMGLLMQKTANVALANRQVTGSPPP